MIELTEKFLDRINQLKKVSSTNYLIDERFSIVKFDTDDKWSLCVSDGIQLIKLRNVKGWEHLQNLYDDITDKPLGNNYSTIVW